MLAVRPSNLTVTETVRVMVTVFLGDQAVQHCVKGTVRGPGNDSSKVKVKFESPGGAWNRTPYQISRTKMEPEDIVCSSSM